MTTNQAEQPTEAPSPGLGCFLDQGRICGADCMAFLSHPPEGQVYLGENWARCILLVNADRGGRHLVVLANVGSKIADIQGKTAATAARSAPAPGVPR